MPKISPKDILPYGDDDPFGYIGHLKFGLAEGKPVIPETTLVGWLDRARDEFMMSRIAAIVANANDEEMEAWVKKCAGPEDMLEAMTEIAERANGWIGHYEDGIEVFTMLATRCIIIGERMEARYLSN